MNNCLLLPIRVVPPLPSEALSNLHQMHHKHRYHYKSLWVYFPYLLLDTYHFLVTHHKKQHFLVYIGIKTTTFDASGCTVQIFKNIVVQSGKAHITDDKQYLVILLPIYHIGQYP